MSCPDWSALAAHRFERRNAEPEGWQAALEHFDSCASCRREALAADPTLLFRRLPEAALTPAGEADEVASMRQAVAAMRTASRLEASHRSFTGWRRWAAAAVLALAALSLGRDGGRVPEQTAMVSSPVPGAMVQPASVPTPPVLEGLNRPGARVYQMDGEGISVLMIVDESLDV